LRYRHIAQRTESSKAHPEKAGILIVDDHPIVRKGLAELINQQTDLQVAAQAQDAAEALTLLRNAEFDLVIVDISLKNSSGIELIGDIKAGSPRLAVLALSMHDESLYAERALRAGAMGYIMKAEATENVVTAIRTVMSGRIYLSERMAGKLIRKFVGAGPEPYVSAVDSLSDRELQVFRLIGEGYGTRQIAERLCLSVKTIETYRAHIKDKLDLADASELLQYAIRWARSRDNT
jgi:DNA-binding NarL/FixJ family response regulator